MQYMITGMFNDALLTSLNAKHLIIELLVVVDENGDLPVRSHRTIEDELKVLGHIASEGDAAKINLLAPDVPVWAGVAHTDRHQYDGNGNHDQPQDAEEEG